MNFEDRLFSMTTIIETIDTSGSIKNQGSGFFYNILSEKDPNSGLQRREAKESWLITNRHVVLPRINDQETIPSSLAFNLRQINGSGHVQWSPIILMKDELMKRLKLHIDSSVDVAAIQVQDLCIDRVEKNKDLLSFLGVTNDDIPLNSEQNIEVSDDVVVAGYPRGFYDHVNKYPIVKSGIIASKWGENFRGQPLFLIDSKLFPGSSGSVVLSKPTRISFDGKSMYYNTKKEFAFLGIYSGEPYINHNPIEFDDMIFIKKDSFNVGNVWYSSLVPEIIENGCYL